MTNGHDPKDKLTGLFKFAEGVLSAKERTILQLQEYKLGIFHEPVFRNLPGIRLAPDDETWLRIDRLRETDPPPPSEHLLLWVAELPKDPSKEPIFHSMVVHEASPEEMAPLQEAGLLLEDDIFPLDNHNSDSTSKKIILRLENLPKINDQLNEWKAKSWQPWSVAEKAVRNTINIYNKFFLLHSLIHGGAGSEPPEVVWGIGISRWEVAPGNIIDMPVIEQLVDIDIENGGTIVVRPRTLRPSISFRAFVELDVDGSSRVQQHLDEQLTKLLTNDDKPITPFEATYWEGLLDVAAARLTNEGQLVNAAECAKLAKLPEPSSKLRIYSSWVLFGRPRSDSFRLHDLESIRQKIENTEDDAKIPDSLKALVGQIPRRPSGSNDFNWDPGATKIGTHSRLTGTDDSGWSVFGTTQPSTPTIKAKAYFFPLPFNDEQSRIIDLLEEHDVVTVTGPPGTGKTHTIANIIAHQMAVGRRVLVTARTAEAISAIREKLPEDLGALVIASVGSDRDSNKQLEDAIRRLSDDVSRVEPRIALEEINRLESTIVQIDRDSADCDRMLAEIAQANFDKLEWRGRSFTPLELQEYLNELAGDISWFDDSPKSPVTDRIRTAISRLYGDLPAIGTDVVYAGINVPDPGSLPSTADLIRAHHTILANTPQVHEDHINQPVMALNDSQAVDRAREVCDYLAASAEALQNAPAWSRVLLSSLLTSHLLNEAPPTALETVNTLMNAVSLLRPAQIDYPRYPSLRDELLTAAIRASSGGRATPIATGLFNRKLSSAIAAIRIDGRVPDSPSDWKSIAESIRFDDQRDKFEVQWIKEADAGMLPYLPAEQDLAFEHITYTAEQLAALIEARNDLISIMPEIQSFFPYGVNVEECLSILDFDTIICAFRANLPTSLSIPKEVTELDSFLLDCSIPIFEEISQLKAMLGNPQVTDRSLVEARGTITAELTRLKSLRFRLDEVWEDLSTIRKAGATEWASRLTLNPNDVAKLIPSDWELGWEASLLKQHLSKIIAMGNGEEARVRRAELRRRREDCFARLIRERALLGLKPRLTDSVQRALSMFTSALQKLGKGTGQNGPRLRRVIREAAMEATPAAPVWIIPEHRIAEQLLPQIGEFDLVILDEASQSDVTAIAPLARGKKHLIVGDAKQVSPATVGLPANKISMLRSQHLSKLPNAQIVDQNTSIFEIAVQMHPSTHIMLREHFRCVEPIIRYSANRHYKSLIPIRIPLPSERLDPPLIDVFVETAVRHGKTNETEAAYIVNEIANIIGDGKNDHRDIGIISLIGREQAEKIQRMLLADPRIGAENIERFGIICGDSRTMQGQERSIVFLSMVATPDTVVTQNTVDMDQRLNVAMSRAKDRVYLVRSVSKQDLKLEDLKLGILEHFENPMPGGHMIDKGILDRCQSGFERDVCTRLIEGMYRVRAQVSAGPYSIDLVVEGEDDRRLAVELDGDIWHGADRWEQDMQRQAVLERAGWTFWRVFGSQWYNDSEYWWHNLQDTLSELGIEPIGSAGTAELFTDFKVVKFGDMSTPDPGADENSEELAS